MSSFSRISRHGVQLLKRVNDVYSKGPLHGLRVQISLHQNDLACFVNQQDAVGPRAITCDSVIVDAHRETGEQNKTNELTQGKTTCFYMMLLGKENQMKRIANKKREKERERDAGQTQGAPTSIEGAHKNRVNETNSDMHGVEGRVSLVQHDQ